MEVHQRYKKKSNYKKKRKDKRRLTRLKRSQNEAFLLPVSLIDF
jgi:hypothetical protein